MNIRDKKKLITLVLIAVGIGILLFLLRSREDTWICQDGIWIKHGNPSATMPPTPCK